MNSLLTVKGLKVQVDEQEILHGVDLEIRPGEIHAIMGPNGSGKSTLSAALMGHPKYHITEGEVTFYGRNLLEMKPEERAALGLFLSFQYPKEIPGVNLVSFMRASYNAIRKAQAKVNGEDYESLSLFRFKTLIMDKMNLVKMPAGFMHRTVNEGFSGGEKKKCEILQMAVLEPKLAVLDETDSGLDIDSLKDICHALKVIREKNLSLLLITHYQRILDYITPDAVHVMMDGRIVMTGGSELGKMLDQKGYDYVREKAGLKPSSSALKMISI